MQLEIYLINKGYFVNYCKLCILYIVFCTRSETDIIPAFEADVPGSSPGGCTRLNYFDLVQESKDFSEFINKLKSTRDCRARVLVVRKCL